jgi:hypothetical protein
MIGRPKTEHCVSQFKKISDFQDQIVGANDQVATRESSVGVQGGCTNLDRLEFRLQTNDELLRLIEPPGVIVQDTAQRYRISSGESSVERT